MFITDKLARAEADRAELLAACKCLLADLEGAIELKGDNVPDCWRLSIQEGQAAIAQATGK